MEIRPEHGENDFYDVPSDESSRGGSVGQVPPASSENHLDKSIENPPFRRSKTSLRLRYEAETEVIRRKLGDLESIRASLNLSQRKMCQLLMVDPSAWTRWTKDGDASSDSAPPHIYRMLQWYLALQDKYPALDVNFWLNTVAPVRDAKDARADALAKEIAELKARINAMENTRATEGMEQGRRISESSLRAIPASMRDATILQSKSVQKLLDLDFDSESEEESLPAKQRAAAIAVANAKMASEPPPSSSRAGVIFSGALRSLSSNWRWMVIAAAAVAAAMAGFAV